MERTAYPVNSAPLLEMWGGAECTVNRVGDVYFDQLERTGHAQRLSDLDRFAELGLRTLRYPILWERVAPNHPDEFDWSWADERLGRLRELGIRPIVGLVHHGSGPRYTDLLDPDFSKKLAAFAAAVARRYPWVEAYTPVNEPLTTARFSGLYGHWYPHHCDDLSFMRALLHQCRGVAQAMQAIREVNPAAQLVQTEDLGRTFSTPALAYQAEFENHRRWLSLDLLAGRVNRQHPLWDHLQWVGVPEEEVAALHESPCPPDVVGVNYYVASDRFLDERIDAYPPHEYGSNGRHVYADVAAVRVRKQGIAGFRDVLREAWDRYKIPLAITEAHLGCTEPEEQLRWLHQAWNDAVAACHDGADVRAVTVWSLLGTYDWNSLVTRDAGHYETGVLDVRHSPLRPAPLAALVRDLAQGRRPNYPALNAPGWWQRPERILYYPDPSVTLKSDQSRSPRPREVCVA